MSVGALRRTALGEVRHSPRFLALMGVLLIAAVGYGARDVSRLRYTTELTGDALGIGVTAVAFAVGLAIGGLSSGPLTDRFDPRRILVIGMVLQGVAALVTGVFLLQGVAAGGVYMLVVFGDGAFAGACIPALATTQAAMVPTTARGAAEIISILRLGVGATLGLVLSGFSPSPVVTQFGVAVILCLVAVPIAAITRPVVMPTRRHDDDYSRRVLDVVRAHPVLSRVIVADLVLCVAVPTQLSNVFLAENWDESMVTPVLAGGVLGVLVGRLVLSLTGSHGLVRRELVESYGVFVLLAIIGIPLVATGFAYRSPWIPAVILFVGSATTAYAQGLLAALVQQQVPDEIRGRLTGAMAAARSLLIAGSAALLTAVVLPWSSLGAVVFVAAVSVAALVALRAFQGIVVSRL
ncbi:MAG: MFS transporter [Actinomycetota bacterium]